MMLGLEGDNLGSILDSFICVLTSPGTRGTLASPGFCQSNIHKNFLDSPQYVQVVYF
jgi:hypothetical protein